MIELEISNLHKVFDIKKRLGNSSYSKVRALNDVSLVLEAGVSLGIVGESGSGKSTLARVIVELEELTFGTIKFQGRNIKEFSKKESRDYRRHVQMVFQDPYSCLNPRMQVAKIVSEGLEAHLDLFPASEHPNLVLKALESVGLGEKYLSKYPRQLSGIARAIVLEPDVLICDEPTSGLDVSIQAQVLNLLKDIQSIRSLSMVFISHDLGVIRHICHVVAVMYQGKIVEFGAVDQVFENPLHPYTKNLIDAIPRLQKVLTRGSQPTRVETQEVIPSEGCAYAPICPRKQKKCVEELPALSTIAGRKVSCFFPLDGSN